MASPDVLSATETSRLGRIPEYAELRDEVLDTEAALMRLYEEMQRDKPLLHISLQKLAVLDQRIAALALTHPGDSALSDLQAMVRDLRHHLEKNESPEIDTAWERRTAQMRAAIDQMGIQRVSPDSLPEGSPTKELVESLRSLGIPPGSVVTRPGADRTVIVILQIHPHPALALPAYLDESGTNESQSKLAAYVTTLAEHSITNTVFPEGVTFRRKLILEPGWELASPFSSGPDWGSRPDSPLFDIRQPKLDIRPLENPQFVEREDHITRDESSTRSVVGNIILSSAIAQDTKPGDVVTTIMGLKHDREEDTPLPYARTLAAEANANVIVVPTGDYDRFLTALKRHYPQYCVDTPVP